MKKFIFTALLAMSVTAAHAEDFIVSWNEPSNAHNLEAVEQLASQTGLGFVHVKNLQSSYDVVRVEGVDVKNTISMLESTGLFSSVEVPATVRLPRMKINPIVNVLSNPDKGIGTNAVETHKFNDTLYLEQEYLDEQEYSRMGLSSILKARDYAEKNVKIDRKVRVAVLDTGRWDHEDMIWSDDEASFLENIYLYGCSSADPTNSGLDVICPNTDVVDLTYSNNAVDKNWFKENDQYFIRVHGHGLAVASQIAAISNNAKGMVGIVPQQYVELIPVKVLNSEGSGGTIGIVDGMLWAMGEYENPVELKEGDVGYVHPISAPVDIINLSLGGSTELSCEANSYMRNAIEMAYQKNISVVIAAGNESTDTTYVTPANCEEAFTVASSKKYGEISNFSNFGQFVDLAAIGEDVLGATVNTLYYNGSYTCGSGSVKVDDCYSPHTGTSMATPNVVGMLALIQMVYPELSAKERESMLLNTSSVLEVDMQGKATRASKVGYGYGVANAYKAIQNKPMDISEVIVSHHYAGYETPVQVQYVTEMKKFVPSACDRYNVQFGTLQHEVTGVNYVIHQTTDDGVETSQTYSVPRAIVDRSIFPNVFVQSCKDGTCGDKVEVDFSNATKPTVCNS